MSVDPYRQPEHIYGVCIALVGHYQVIVKKLLVTFHDLK